MASFAKHVIGKNVFHLFLREHCQLTVTVLSEAPIPVCVPHFGSPSHRAVSRKLWVLLAPVVSADDEKQLIKKPWALSQTHLQPPDEVGWPRLSPGSTESSVTLTSGKSQKQTLEFTFGELPCLRTNTCRSLNKSTVPRNQVTIAGF